jgi:hypothetical protein
MRHSGFGTRSDRESSAPGDLGLEAIERRLRATPELLTIS